MLYQLSGYAAVLVVVSILTARWILKGVASSLRTYVEGYAQQQASIDARIANLEKLAQEQSRLTTVVEAIKHEFVALERNESNKWNFKMDVYSKLTLSLVGILTKLYHLRAIQANLIAQQKSPQERDAILTSMFQSKTLEFEKAVDTFVQSSNLAPLATANEVLPLIREVTQHFPALLSVHHDVTALDRIVGELEGLLFKLQAVGRKDLWGNTEATLS